MEKKGEKKINQFFAQSLLSWTFCLVRVQLVIIIGGLYCSIKVLLWFFFRYVQESVWSEPVCVRTQYKEILFINIRPIGLKCLEVLHFVHINDINLSDFIDKILHGLLIF